MRLSETDSFQFEQRGQAPGQAINVKNKEGSEVKFVSEAEFYQLPGIASGPTKGDRLAVIQLEGGYEIVIASHNYKVNVSIQAGQTKIYSTDASGNTKKAEIFLDTNGNINISQDGETTFEENVNMDKELIVSDEITVGSTNIKVSRHGHITVLGPTVGPILPVQ